MIVEFFSLCFLTLLLVSFALRMSRLAQQRRRGTVLGVFHPYAAAMGGGERVMWCGVAHLLEANPQVSVRVYTGDVVDLDKIRERFGSGSCPLPKVSFTPNLTEQTLSIISLPLINVNV